VTAVGDAQTPPGPRAGRREWIGPAMPALLVSMDLTVLHLAAPEPEARP